MKNNNFHIYLNEEEYKHIIQALIDLKNALIQQDKYTDAVDDVLIKLFEAKKKSVKIKYV